jgi:hypothetical protein
VAEHRLLDAATAELGEGRAAAEFGQIFVDHEPCNARDRGPSWLGGDAAG